MMAGSHAEQSEASARALPINPGFSAYSWPDASLSLSMTRNGVKKTGCHAERSEASARALPSILALVPTPGRMLRFA